MRKQPCPCGPCALWELRLEAFDREFHYQSPWGDTNTMKATYLHQRNVIEKAYRVPCAAAAEAKQTAQVNAAWSAFTATWAGLADIHKPPKNRPAPDPTDDTAVRFSLIELD